MPGLLLAPFGIRLGEKQVRNAPIASETRHRPDMRGFYLLEQRDSHFFPSKIQNSLQFSLVDVAAPKRLVSVLMALQSAWCASGP